LFQYYSCDITTLINANRLTDIVAKRTDVNLISVSHVSMLYTVKRQYRSGDSTWLFPTPYAMLFGSCYEVWNS